MKKEKHEASIIHSFEGISYTHHRGKSYNINHYNLSAIIAADNKVDSPCAV